MTDTNTPTDDGQAAVTTPTSTADITIVHTRQHGTIVYGTTRNDGTGKILHKHRFSGSEYLEVPVDEELGDPYWYMPHSQRSRADRYYIDQAAAELRDAGWTVEITIDDTTPAVGFWELEARKYQHAAYREERLRERAGAAHGTAESIRESNQRTYEALNGTPMLVDHYSYNRHKNLLDRLWKREGKVFALMDKAGDLIGRAQAARNFQGRREAHGTTLRRIQKLEKHLRDIEKTMDGSTQWFGLTSLVEGKPSEMEAAIERLTGLGIPIERTGNVYRGCEEVWVGVSDHHEAVLAAEMVETVEEIAYWEDLIAASGKKVWRAEDFAKGDFVGYGGRWLEVVKVSGRTLTVPSRYERGVEIQTMAGLAARVRHPKTTTIPYDEINGKLTAQEARERFPEEFARLLEGEDLPKRPAMKRGDVKITGGGGAECERWSFILDRQDYSAVWREPEYTVWYGPPTPVADPAPIRVFKTFGLSSRPSELIAEVEVPPGIRWREDVFNVLRAWVEEFARQHESGSTE